MSGPDLTKEEVAKLKRIFAEALLRNPNKPVVAGQITFPDAPNYAFRASNEWVYDPEVIEFQRQLIAENGQTAYMPTKEELANLILSEATALNPAGNRAMTEEGRLKAYRLYAEIRGFIEKPTVAIDNRSVTLNKVMIMKDHGQDDDWAERTKAQQARLIADASRAVN